MNNLARSRLWLPVVAAVHLFLVSVAQAAEVEDTEFTHEDYPAWFVDDPFLDLQDGLDAALAEGKKGLMVLFTTEGCSYCGAFVERSLGDPEIAAAVQAEFTSIGLEIFDDRELTAPDGTPQAVKHFADAEGAGFSPTLLFYGENGERVFRAVGYQSPERFVSILDYIAGGHYRDTRFQDFVNPVAATADAVGATVGLRQDPLFSKPPYALDRSRFAASQPLLVLFEQADCMECTAFHDKVLALEEVRVLLGEFEIVRLDATDGETPVLSSAGQRTTPTDWYRESGFTRLPAMAFFNEAGDQVLETDALVQRQRMLNSLLYMIERAYDKNWTYQRFARSKAIERNLAAQAADPKS